jgi:hypothetical protein
LHALTRSAANTGEDCHVNHIVPDDLPAGINEGVRRYALDPESAEALWKKSEEMVGESF